MCDHHSNRSQHQFSSNRSLAVAMTREKGSFRKLQNFRPDYAVAEFTQYESERTGMRVAVVDQKGPKVNGYFTLATEIHDDSGAPHTLEHLIFMGSKSYRYKGVLDKLATRAYSFTNAWTATDHTAYTLDTAGWAGFAQILPVYLEHVLFPTLTDSACYTEVWHIDGSGNDAGVVYSEMQGVQNNQSELMELEARRILYPEGNGFRYETGGMMEALRVLTADRIREFHKDMYQPKNLRLVIIGEIDHTELLDILEAFEDSIMDDIPPVNSPFQRPWIDSKPTPELKESVTKTVEFPEEDESSGEVLIGFFGPEFRNITESGALDILLNYLAGSSVSLLENIMVEKEELCSAVYHSQDSRPNALLWFTLSSVATEKLAAVEQRFFDIVREATTKPLDMGYMQECIKRYRRGVIYAAEASTTLFSEPFIEDHLFGDRDGEGFEEAIKTLKLFDTLASWSEKQWQDFLSKYIAHNKHVTILGVPSSKLSKKLKSEETARVKAQQDKLGEDGLKNLGEKLEKAKAENDREIPREILAAFKVPSPESIHFVPSLTARSGLAKKMGHLDNEAQKYLDKDTSDLPLFIHFEHVPTNFIHLSMVLSTSPVPVELKPLLSVYVMNFLTTAIERDGQKIEFEEVVKELEQDTISYDMGNAGSMGCSELLRIRFVVEREKYETAVKWLRDLCFNGVFEADRLKPTLTKILADIPDTKRSGSGMLNAVDVMLQTGPASNSRAQNTLVKALYLKRVSRMLSSEPEAVIKKLEEIRTCLFTFSNVRVFCTADLSKLEKPIATWELFTKGLDTTESLKPLDTKRAILSEAGRKPGKIAYIVPMATIDSSFGILTAKGIDSYDHPKLPALMVAIAYLDAVEGPMWVAVRGTGLAYGTHFSRSTDAGTLSFNIYRSPDAYKAYLMAKEVIADFASGKKEFDEFALEGAVSSIVMSFADEQPTMIDAANVGFVNQVVKGIPKDWSHAILRQVRDVTPQQIKEAMHELLLPVFNPETANVVVTCATIMEEVSHTIYPLTKLVPETKR